MPISTDEESCGIPVKVYLMTGEINRGMLVYCKEGPIINLDGGILIDSSENVQLSFLENSTILKTSKLTKNDHVLLKPDIVTELGYSPEGLSRIQMYPPSSGNWLAHIVDSGIESIVTTQRIVGTSKLLLTIADKNTAQPYLATTIRSYENNILQMKRDWNVLSELTYRDIQGFDIFDVLKTKSLSWESLSRLVEGVTIPNLTRKKTMEETLSQLIPESFSIGTRKQIMAFLGWLESAKIPDEDPIEFSMKYQKYPVFWSLVNGHLQCILDNVDPPHYVRILTMADRGQLQFSERPHAEAAEQDPWLLVKHRLTESFPDWTGRVLDYVISLKEDRKTVTQLPVSKNDAIKSQRAWSDRFGMVNFGVFMRGHIHKKAIGMLPVIYVGAAHRWPHKHLEWSARLGYGSDNPQYIQILVMPPAAFERVTRAMPAVRLIDWEMSSYNLTLYSNKEQKWKINASLISKSIERKRTIKQLANEFGSWQGMKHYKLSPKQARILDLISWGLYFSSLETNRYAKYYGIENSEIENELQNMLDRGLYELHYFLIPEKLRSLCYIANGPSERVCSLSRAFLKHAPSAQVRITDRGASSNIVSRIPEDDYYNLVTVLNKAAGEHGISLRTLPISAYAGYRNNLYSRLLKSDGSWDDDVSGLLDQIRLPPKNAE